MAAMAAAVLVGDGGANAGTPRRLLLRFGGSVALWVNFNGSALSRRVLELLWDFPDLGAAFLESVAELAAFASVVPSLCSWASLANHFFLADEFHLFLTMFSL